MGGALVAILFMGLGPAEDLVAILFVWPGPDQALVAILFMVPGPAEDLVAILFIFFCRSCPVVIQWPVIVVKML